MKKILIAGVVMVFLVLQGCATTKPSSTPTYSGEKIVWWGTKAEVISFLNSPEAKAERWRIESLD